VQEAVLLDGASEYGLSVDVEFKASVVRIDGVDAAERYVQVP
jgi:hypothetical protein